MRNSILAVFAQDTLEFGRILQARHLHQNAVGALPLGSHRLEPCQAG